MKLLLAGEGDAPGQIDGTEHASALPTTHRHSAEVGMLDPPCRVASVAEVGVDVMGVERRNAGGDGWRGAGNVDVADERRQLAILVELVDLGGRATCLDFDHDLEAHRDLRGHLGVTAEDKAGGRVGVVQAVVGLRGLAIVVPNDGAVDLSADRQGHLAIALACGRGFQLCDALFKVCAAVAAEVGRLG